MTMIEFFTVVASIATAVYTFVAFKTLLEIKAQRETSYRPDIIIEENDFYIYSCETSKGLFPTEYTYQKNPNDYKTTHLNINSFNINLYNIGLATAKEVNIEYSFDLESIISIIKKMNETLPKEKIIDIEYNKKFIEFIPSENAVSTKSFHSITNQLKNNVNHILPISISNNSIKILLPSYVLQLYSILIYNTWLDNSKSKEFPDLPLINLKFEYLDIGNKKHKKEYELSIQYNGGSKTESWNSFKVKQKNCA